MHLPFNATRQSSRWIQSAESPAPAPTQCPDPFTLSTTHPDQGIPDPRTDFDPLTAAFPAEFPQPDPSQVSDRMLPPTFPRKSELFHENNPFSFIRGGHSAPPPSPTIRLFDNSGTPDPTHLAPPARAVQRSAAALRCLAAGVDLSPLFLRSHPANRPAADPQPPHVSTPLTPACSTDSSPLSFSRSLAPSCHTISVSPNRVREFGFTGVVLQVRSGFQQVQPLLLSELFDIPVIS